MIIEVHTQAEFDALPDKFSEYTYIQIKTDNTFRIVVNKAMDKLDETLPENAVISWTA